MKEKQLRHSTPSKHCCPGTSFQTSLFPWFLTLFYHAFLCIFDYFRAWSLEQRLGYNCIEKEVEDKKSTEKPKEGINQHGRSLLCLTTASHLCHCAGEEEMEDRAGSPVPALSFAVTSDKSIPKTTAPQILRLTQLENISRFVGIWPSSMPHLQLTLGNKGTRTNTFQVTKTLRWQLLASQY